MSAFTHWIITLFLWVSLADIIVTLSYPLVDINRLRNLLNEE